MHSEEHLNGTVSALPQIIRALRAGRYEFVTISELLSRIEDPQGLATCRNRDRRNRRTRRFSGDGDAFRKLLTYAGYPV